MTHTERILLAMLKATTLALRVLLGHIEAPFAQTAREMANGIVTDEEYRRLSGTARAALADAGTAIVEAAGAAKGLKR